MPRLDEGLTQRLLSLLTDELMFSTPFDDKRLANKQEILALRFAAAPNEQLEVRI